MFPAGLQRCRDLRPPSVWSGRMAATLGWFGTIPFVVGRLDRVAGYRRLAGLWDGCALRLELDTEATTVCRFGVDMGTRTFFHRLLMGYL